MSAYLVDAAVIPPPITGSTTTVNVARLAVPASSTRFIIPDEWKGCYVTFQAKGGQIHLVFGGSGVTADTTANTISSEAITARANASYRIPQDQERSFKIPKYPGSGVNANFPGYFAAISDAASGVELECFISSKKA